MGSLIHILYFWWSGYLIDQVVYAFQCFFQILLLLIVYILFEPPFNRHVDFHIEHLQ